MRNSNLNCSAGFNALASGFVAAGLALAAALVVRSLPVNAQEASAAAAEMTLKGGTWTDVQDLIAAHPGKIVVVDVWSTACLPCMSEFPGLVALHSKYPKDVLCVSFNIDYVGIKSRPADTYRERVEKFLSKQKAVFPNFLCSKEADAVFAELKLTSIPAVYVFGRDGKLAKRFDDSLLEDGEEEAFTYKDDINPFVESLVNQK